jgi:hypothetical protein
VAADSFEFDINVRADSAAAAAVAVERLSTQLEVAKSAATEAAAAVSAQEGVYKSAASAAEKAATAHEKITQKLDEQKAALARMAASPDAVNPAAYQRASEKVAELTARQNEAASAAAKAKAALDAEAATLDKLKASSTNASAAQDKIAKAQGQAKNASAALQKTTAAASGSGKINEVGEAFGKLGGPLGSIGQKAFGAAEGFKKMGASLGSAGPYVAIAVAIVAIATAALTLTAAVAAGVATIGAWAVGLADAARTQRLLAAGIAQSVAGGEQLTATIKNLQTKVPATQEELLALAKPLADAGLRGKELDVALEAAAIKAAKLKFGPEFAKQMQSLPFQTQRLKTLFTGLFSGLKIDVLLARLEKFVDLFDETSATGKAIKVIFESLFQPLIDGVSAWIPKMVSGFIQFEILVMKAMIAIKPFGSTILEVAKYFGILAGVVALMTVGFAVAVIAPFAVIIGLATLLIAAVVNVAQAFIGFYQKLQSMTLGEIGAQMIQGLIDGIVGKAQAVIGAITGVVSGGINAAKSALGIASPSKVFAEIGTQTAEGMSGGVDEGAKDVQGSLESMVAPPAEAGAPAAAPAAAPSGGGSSGGAPVFYIEINGVAGAEDIGPSLIQTLEAWVAQRGGALASA